MIQTRSFFLLVLSLVVTGCVPRVRVETAHDPSVHLSEMMDFSMMLPNKALPSKNSEVNPFILQRLRQLTYLHLRDRGFKPTSKKEADLLVAVFATRKQRIDVYPSSSFGWGYGPGMYGYGYGPVFGPSAWSSQVMRTDEGVVVVDLIDRRSNAVVWRGTAVRVIEPDFDEQKLNEMVEAIVQEMPIVSQP